MSIEEMLIDITERDLGAGVTTMCYTKKVSYISQLI